MRPRKPAPVSQPQFAIALAAFLVLAYSPTATATSFTISGAVDLEEPESVVFVTVNPEQELLGPVNCLLFTCDLLATDVLFFSAQETQLLFSSSLAQLSVEVPGVVFADLRAVGSIANPTRDSPIAANADVDGKVTFDFAAGDPPDVLSTTEVLFVSFAPGTLDPATQSAEFAMRRITGGGLPGFGTPVAVGLAQLPEPSGWIVLGMCLGSFALRSSFS